MTFPRAKQPRTAEATAAEASPPGLSIRRSDGGLLGRPEVGVMRQHEYGYRDSTAASTGKSDRGRAASVSRRLRTACS